MPISFQTSFTQPLNSVQKTYPTLFNGHFNKDYSVILNIWILGMPKNPYNIHPGIKQLLSQDEYWALLQDTVYYWCTLGGIICDGDTYVYI